MQVVPSLVVFILLPTAVGGSISSHQFCQFSSSPPSNAELSEVPDVVFPLMTIFRRLHWSSVILISDEHDESWGNISRLLTSLSNDFRKFSVFDSSVAWQPQGLPAMVTFGPGGATQSLDIVLVCSKACVISVLDGAKKFEDRWKSQTALTHRSRWLVHVTDITDITHVDWINVTMDNVVLTAWTRVRNSTTCPGADMATRSREALGIFTLTLSSQGRDLSLISYCCDNFTVDGERMFPNSQYGLNGKLLRVGMKAWIHFEVNRGPNGTESYGGFDFLLLDTLAQLLNFTYQIMFPRDNNWGSRGKNGNWTGLIGMLQRREVDAVIQPFHRSNARDEVVDFSNVVDINTNTFVYRRSPPSTYGFMTYFKPLRIEVIFTIFAAMLVTSALVYAAEHHLEAEASPTSPGLRRWWYRVSDFGDCLQFSFWALLHKADPCEARTWSGRIIVSCWWIFCVIIAATYTGNLVAFLAVPREGFPISSLEDLVSQTQYKWGVLGSGSLHAFVQDSNVSLHQQLWQGVERFSRDDPDVLSLDDSVHISKVLQEKYIFIASTGTVQQWLDRHCELAMDQRGFGSTLAAVMFQKNSVYEPMFSRKMLQMQESGLWKELKWQWRQQLQGAPCHVAESTKAPPASLVEVQSALYVLVAGAATALLVLALEAVVCRLGRRSDSEQSN